MPVRIVTDSACDLDQALVDQHGIEVVPLSIRFGDEEYVDRVELSVDDFYAKMAQTDTLPETAAPSPGAGGPSLGTLATRQAVPAQRKARPRAGLRSLHATSQQPVTANPGVVRFCKGLAHYASRRSSPDGRNVMSVTPGGNRR